MKYKFKSVKYDPMSWVIFIEIIIDSFVIGTFAGIVIIESENLVAMIFGLFGTIMVTMMLMLFMYGFVVDELIEEVE